MNDNIAIYGDTSWAGDARLVDRIRRCIRLGRIGPPSSNSRLRRSHVCAFRSILTPGDPGGTGETFGLRGGGFEVQDVREERFEIFVPDTYSTNGLWGALISISPGSQPRLPVGWAAELASQRVLFVAPCHAGNERDSGERCRLALDAVYSISKRYRIDRRRLFVGGFSGGGRIASALGVASRTSSPERFACVVSISIKMFPPARAGNTWRVTARERVTSSKRANAGLSITGERDMNRDNTQRVREYRL